MVLSSTQSGRVRITGGGLSNDANHISGPSRTGKELSVAIDHAMKSTGIPLGEIDFISAHGTATLYNDEMEAKAFAQAVCAQMAEDSPDRYLINMAKKQRTGRIFLDYLRNDRMATAVAPLSPRLREGAPVSMPLTWSQVKAGLDPMRYTVRTAPPLIAKSTAWKDYCDAVQPLEPAIRKLVGPKGKRSRAAADTHARA